MCERICTLPSKRPVQRLVIAVLVVALCLCAICGKVLLDGRQAAWDRAAEAGSSLVTTLALDIARNIESYDLSLHAVIENLEFPEITQVSPALRQAILFDRSTNAKHLDALLLTDEKGIVRLDFRTAFPQPVSRAGRDYFQFHLNNNSPDLYVSRPAIARSTGNAVVAVSRRVSHPDGSFAGVAVGSIRLSYFQQLFKAASLGSNEASTAPSFAAKRSNRVLLETSPLQALPHELPAAEFAVGGLPLAVCPALFFGRPPLRRQLALKLRVGGGR